MRVGRLLLDDKPYPQPVLRMRRRSRTRQWALAGIEPSVTEILADPITLLLMRADRLEVAEVETLMRAARQRRSLQ